jgi:tRNA threonylcarbamoyladenosine biosynthesis protein TsaB
MIVLGLDTATPATAVGLRLSGGETLQARDDPAPGEHPGHATRLLAMAGGLLVEAGIGWSALQRIAVGVGPGTFTGLRVGIATARGLAQALAVEIVGVSSLRALAEPALEEARERPVLAAIDARRGEVFAAAYAAGGEELMSPRTLAPNELDGVLARAAGRWLAVGDGVLCYRDHLQTTRVDIPENASPLHRVSAAAICAQGASAAAAGHETILPDYCRRPDAEIALEGATR